MSLILRVAARGDGVADDGRHAPLSAPGDTLTDTFEVIPGPHHQPAPCRHFPQCGGCQLQHLDDESYAAFVADRIHGALDAQGLFAPLRPTLLSPPRTRRRATLHADRGLIGFTAEASHQIVDMRECHILAPDLFTLVAPLRALFQKLGLKRRADVHLALADQGPDILVTGFAPQGLDAAETLTAFCERHGVARFSVDDGLGAETRWEPQPVTITLGGIPVAFPPGGFLQATQEGEDALVAAVREAVGGAKTIADLFAGLGTFALALPAKVYAAEGARDALLSFKAAANARGLPIFAEHRDLYRRPLTVAELNRFDAVVLDPPRAGAREQAAALAECTVGSIGYVSCNPSSFARDAKMLCEFGWRIDWVQPVGQFRWSTHVELAARFVR
jgi:23S rRNA (uracil1939-C5)-methyltransferase